MIEEIELPAAVVKIAAVLVAVAAAVAVGRRVTEPAVQSRLDLIASALAAADLQRFAWIRSVAAVQILL